MQKAKLSNKILTAALLAGTMLSTPAVAAEITGNVGATTDYIWRGNTQADGDASLSGGIDVDFGNGFAVGTWVGSLGRSTTTADDTNQLSASDDANYELDLYASYGGEIGNVGYEIGYIAYEYPGAANSAADFSEVYVSFGAGPLSLSYYVLADAEDADFDKNDGTYLSLDAEFPLIQDWALTVHYGEESGDTSQDDEDVSLTLSKGDMAFTVSGNDGDDTRAIISWGASF